jgi:hypothetical protein
VTNQDAPRWWRACLLAERDQVDELRKLAAGGHARRRKHSLRRIWEENGLWYLPSRLGRAAA